MPACHPTGLSLVELMIALAIGVVLALAVTQFFLRSKISYLQDEELARMRENGRYALRYMRHELSMAGYLGGVTDSHILASTPGGSICFDYVIASERPLEHFNDVTTDGDTGDPSRALPPACLAAGRHQADTDMVLVRRTKDMAIVQQGQERALPDRRSLYLRVESWGASVGLVRGGGRIDSTVDLWEYIPQLVFVRNYSSEPDDGIPTLCRMRLSPTGPRMAPVECLIEGVEQLQLSYGIDEDGDHQADRFETRPAPDVLRQAVAVRVYLLVRSIHPLAGYVNANSYQLGEKSVAARGDGYLRQVMGATVPLRNMPGYRL